MQEDRVHFLGREAAIGEDVERLARVVIGAAIEVHRELGPGLPERVYRLALSHELTLRHIPHVCEHPIDVVYKGMPVGQGFVDIFVDAKLVVELKAVDSLVGTHTSQVVAYLQVLHLHLGLLINFNVNILKDSLKRVIKS